MDCPEVFAIAALSSQPDFVCDWLSDLAHNVFDIGSRRTELLVCPAGHQVIPHFHILGFVDFPQKHQQFFQQLLLS